MKELFEQMNKDFGAFTKEADAIINKYGKKVKKMKSFQLIVRYDSELKETTISSGYNTTISIPDDESIYDIGESVKYYLKEIEVEETDSEGLQNCQRKTSN